MGLDVVLKKVIEPTAENIASAEAYSNNISMNIVSGIEGQTELNIFADHIFKKSIEYNDFEKTFNDLGLKFEDYEWRSCGEDPTGKYNHEEEIKDFWWKFQHSDTKEDLWVADSNVVKFFVEEDCIVATEVGYQRKGANKQFYDDGMWGAPCITDKATVIEHWNKYFSETAELKKHFQENILNKFKEGETYLIYC